MRKRPRPLKYLLPRLLYGGLLVGTWSGCDTFWTPQPPPPTQEQIEQLNANRIALEAARQEKHRAAMAERIGDRMARYGENGHDRGLAVDSHLNWSTPQTAADALARIGPAAVRSLVEVVERQPGAARHRALEILARIGPGAAEAVPVLREMLRDSDPDTRRLAARALGQIGPAAADAVPELIDALDEEK